MQGATERNRQGPTAAARGVSKALCVVYGSSLQNHIDIGCMYAAVRR